LTSLEIVSVKNCFSFFSSIVQFSLFMHPDQAQNTTGTGSDGHSCHLRHCPSIFGFFRGSLHMLLGWCLGFWSILLKSVIKDFRPCLVYIVRSYLATMHVRGCIFIGMQKIFTQIW